MRRYLTEIIGSFFLVLIVGLANGLAPGLGALAIGMELVGLTYMGAHLSGAHYNPAVTLGVMMIGRIRLVEVGFYIASQLLGAIVAGLALWVLSGAVYEPATSLKSWPMTLSPLSTRLLFEFLGSLLLVLVFLNATHAPNNTPNPFFGAAVGLTLAALLLVGSRFSGNAFNPAVAVGMGVSQLAVGGGSGGLRMAWGFILAPAVGAIAAVLVYRIQNGYPIVGRRRWGRSSEV